jgi:hypothetical protein
MDDDERQRESIARSRRWFLFWCGVMVAAVYIKQIILEIMS